MHWPACCVTITCNNNDINTKHPVTPLPLPLAPADEQDVDAAIQAARKAFDDGPWPRMGGKVRHLVAAVLHSNRRPLLRRVSHSVSSGCPLHTQALERFRFRIIAAGGCSVPQSLETSASTTPLSLTPPPLCPHQFPPPLPGSQPPDAQAS